MHLVTDKNHEMVMEVAEECNLPLDLARRLVRDWEAGRNMRLAKAFEDQMKIARQNSREQHRGVDGVGQCVSRIAFSLEHELRFVFGAEALKDARFMRDLDRKHGLGLKPNYQRKARIMHPGLAS